eukprot:GHVP01017174.1.p1 GENE.GHVP01017174.1~~GHVP01017174.1.p1  ORF type:complete len:3954 (+),score=686.54 GHVP01017174.1:36-11897(+)
MITDDLRRTLEEIRQITLRLEEGSIYLDDSNLILILETESQFLKDAKEADSNSHAIRMKNSFRNPKESKIILDILLQSEGLLPCVYSLRKALNSQISSKNISSLSADIFRFVLTIAGSSVAASRNFGSLPESFLKLSRNIALEAIKHDTSVKVRSDAATILPAFVLPDVAKETFLELWDYLKRSRSKVPLTLTCSLLRTAGEICFSSSEEFQDLKIIYQFTLFVIKMCISSFESAKVETSLLSSCFCALRLLFYVALVEEIPHEEAKKLYAIVATVARDTSSDRASYSLGPACSAMELIGCHWKFFLPYAISENSKAANPFIESAIRSSESQNKNVHHVATILVDNLIKELSETKKSETPSNSFQAFVNSLAAYVESLLSELSASSETSDETIFFAVKRLKILSKLKSLSKNGATFSSKTFVIGDLFMYTDLLFWKIENSASILLRVLPDMLEISCDIFLEKDKEISLKNYHTSIHRYLQKFPSIFVETFVKSRPKFCAAFFSTFSRLKSSSVWDSELKEIFCHFVFQSIVGDIINTKLDRVGEFWEESVKFATYLLTKKSDDDITQNKRKKHQEEDTLFSQGNPNKEDLIELIECLTSSTISFLRLVASKDKKCIAEVSEASLINGRDLSNDSEQLQDLTLLVKLQETDTNANFFRKAAKFLTKIFTKQIAPYFLESSYFTVLFEFCNTLVTDPLLPGACDLVSHCLSVFEASLKFEEEEEDEIETHKKKKSEFKNEDLSDDSGLEIEVTKEDLEENENSHLSSEDKAGQVFDYEAVENHEEVLKLLTSLKDIFPILQKNDKIQVLLLLLDVPDGLLTSVKDFYTIALSEGNKNLVLGTKTIKRLILSAKFHMKHSPHLINEILPLLPNYLYIPDTTTAVIGGQSTARQIMKVSKRIREDETATRRSLSKACLQLLGLYGAENIAKAFEMHADRIPCARIAICCSKLLSPQPPEEANGRYASLGACEDHLSVSLDRKLKLRLDELLVSTIDLWDRVSPQEQLKLSEALYAVSVHMTATLSCQLENKPIVDLFICQLVPFVLKVISEGIPISKLLDYWTDQVVSWLTKDANSNKHIETLLDKLSVCLLSNFSSSQIGTSTEARNTFIKILTLFSSSESFVKSELSVYKNLFASLHDIANKAKCEGSVSVCFSCIYLIKEKKRFEILCLDLLEALIVFLSHHGSDLNKSTFNMIDKLLIMVVNGAHKSFKMTNFSSIESFFEWLMTQMIFSPGVENYSEILFSLISKFELTDLWKRNLKISIPMFYQKSINTTHHTLFILEYLLKFGLVEDGAEAEKISEKIKILEPQAYPSIWTSLSNFPNLLKLESSKKELLSKFLKFYFEQESQISLDSFTLYFQEDYVLKMVLENHALLPDFDTLSCSQESMLSYYYKYIDKLFSLVDQCLIKSFSTDDNNNVLAYAKSILKKIKFDPSKSPPSPSFLVNYFCLRLSSSLILLSSAKIEIEVLDSDLISFIFHYQTQHHSQLVSKSVNNALSILYKNKYDAFIKSVRSLVVLKTREESDVNAVKSLATFLLLETSSFYSESENKTVPLFLLHIFHFLLCYVSMDDLLLNLPVLGKLYIQFSSPLLIQAYNNFLVSLPVESHSFGMLILPLVEKLNMAPEDAENFTNFYVLFLRLAVFDNQAKQVAIACGNTWLNFTSQNFPLDCSDVEFGSKDFLRWKNSHILVLQMLKSVFENFVQDTKDETAEENIKKINLLTIETSVFSILTSCLRKGKRQKHIFSKENRNFLVSVVKSVVENEMLSFGLYDHMFHLLLKNKIPPALFVELAIPLLFQTNVPVLEKVWTEHWTNLTKLIIISSPETSFSKDLELPSIAASIFEILVTKTPQDAIRGNITSKIEASKQFPHLFKRIIDMLKPLIDLPQQDKEIEDTAARLRVHAFSTIAALLLSTQNNVKLFNAILIDTAPYHNLTLQIPESQFKHLPLELQTLCFPRMQYSSDQSTDYKVLQAEARKTLLFEPKNEFQFTDLPPSFTFDGPSLSTSLNLHLKSSLANHCSQVAIQDVLCSLHPQSANILRSSLLPTEKHATPDPSSSKLKASLSPLENWKASVGVFPDEKQQKLRGIILGFGTWSEENTWEKEILEFDFLNTQPILTTLLKIVDSMCCQILSSGSFLVTLFKKLLSSCNKTIKFLAVRIITLRSKAFEGHAINELFPNLVDFVTSDSFEAGKTFHYILRDLCQAFVVLDCLVPTTDLQKSAAQTFINFLVRIAAHPKLYWMMVHCTIIRVLVKRWSPFIQFSSTSIQKLLAFKVADPSSISAFRALGFQLAMIWTVECDINFTEIMEEPNNSNLAVENLFDLAKSSVTSVSNSAAELIGNLMAKFPSDYLGISLRKFYSSCKTESIRESVIARIGIICPWIFLITPTNELLSTVIKAVTKADFTSANLSIFILSLVSLSDLNNNMEATEEKYSVYIDQSDIDERIEMTLNFVASSLQLCWSQILKSSAHQEATALACSLLKSGTISPEMVQLVIQTQTESIKLCKFRADWTEWALRFFDRFDFSLCCFQYGYAENPQIFACLCDFACPSLGFFGAMEYEAFQIKLADKLDSLTQYSKKLNEQELLGICTKHLLLAGTAKGIWLAGEIRGENVVRCLFRIMVSSKLISDQVVIRGNFPTPSPDSEDSASLVFGSTSNQSQFLISNRLRTNKSIAFSSLIALKKKELSQTIAAPKKSQNTRKEQSYPKDSLAASLQFLPSQFETLNSSFRESQTQTTSLKFHSFVRGSATDPKNVNIMHSERKKKQAIKEASGLGFKEKLDLSRDYIVEKYPQKIVTSNEFWKPVFLAGEKNADLSRSLLTNVYINLFCEYDAEDVQENFLECTSRAVVTNSFLWQTVVDILMHLSSLTKKVETTWIFCSTIASSAVDVTLPLLELQGNRNFLSGCLSYFCEKNDDKEEKSEVPFFSVRERRKELSLLGEWGEMLDMEPNLIDDDFDMAPEEVLTTLEYEETMYWKTRSKLLAFLDGFIKNNKCNFYDLEEVSPGVSLEAIHTSVFSIVIDLINKRHVDASRTALDSKYDFLVTKFTETPILDIQQNLRCAEILPLMSEINEVLKSTKSSLNWDIQHLFSEPIKVVACEAQSKDVRKALFDEVVCAVRSALAVDESLRSPEMGGPRTFYRVGSLMEAPTVYFSDLALKYTEIDVFSKRLIQTAVNLHEYVPPPFNDQGSKCSAKKLQSVCIYKIRELRNSGKRSSKNFEEMIELLSEEQAAVIKGSNGSEEVDIGLEVLKFEISRFSTKQKQSDLGSTIISALKSSKSLSYQVKADSYKCIAEYFQQRLLTSEGRDFDESMFEIYSHCIEEIFRLCEEGNARKFARKAIPCMLQIYSYSKKVSRPLKIPTKELVPWLSDIFGWIRISCDKFKSFFGNSIEEFIQSDPQEVMSSLNVLMSDIVPYPSGHFLRNLYDYAICAQPEVHRLILAFHGCIDPNLKFKHELQLMLKFQQEYAKNKSSSFYKEAFVRVWKRFFYFTLSPAFPVSSGLGQLGSAAGEVNVEFAKEAARKIEKNLGVKEGFMSVASQREFIMNALWEKPEKIKQLISIKEEPIKCSNVLNNWAPLLHRFNIQSQEKPLLLNGLQTAVIKFLPEVTTLQSKQRPKKLSFVTKDLKIHCILIKGCEDLRIDQRMENLLSLSCSFETNNLRKKHSLRGFHVQTLSPLVGLVQWLPNTITLKMALESILNAPIRKLEAYDTFTRLLNFDPRDISRTYSRIWDIKNSDCISIFKKSVKMLPLQGRELETFIFQSSITPLAFIVLRRSLLASMGSMSAFCYIFGIGDRHLDNTLIDCKTFEAIPIDFGYSFDFCITSLPVPELMPFRLTPTVTSMLDRSKSAFEEFKGNLEKTIKSMRENNEFIESACEVFVNDPLTDISWLSQASAQSSPNSATSNNFSQDILSEAFEERDSASGALPEYMKSKIAVTKQKLAGVHPCVQRQTILRSTNPHIL